PAEQRRVVPVGADWTDNRSLVGYVNHFRTATTGRSDTELPTYQLTPALELILRASQPANANRPHFLILDEMNMSHVERYFSDFLSAMESQDGLIPLHTARSPLPATD